VAWESGGYSVTEDICPLTLVKEGKAVIQVCDLSAYADEKGYVDPAWVPVFYNPRMACSRDISSAVVGAFAEVCGRSLVVADVLCATGVRGIRYALENEGVATVFLNDIDPKCFNLTLRNIRLNGLEGRAFAFNYDAVKFLLEHRRIDVIDVDPFGSPARFVDPAIRAIVHGGMLCVTATDTAALMGKYPGACLRKYSSLCYSAEFSREIAVRVLLQFLAREAAKLGAAVKPLISYYMDHHVRVCVQVLRKRPDYEQLTSKLGYLVYNPKTLHRQLVKLDELGHQKLGEDYVVSGPLWAGEFADGGFVERVLKIFLERAELGYCKRGAKLLVYLKEEVSKAPLYYTTDSLVSSYGLRAEVSVEKLVRVLSERGFSSSRTHFDGKGFRTSAPLDVILETFRELSSAR